MSKIFVFGSNGMLGTYVVSYLINCGCNVIAFTRLDFDISNLTDQLLDDFILVNNIGSNDVVVNCAGVIPQAVADKSSPLYYIINSMFPISLDKMAAKHGFKFIHVTTDCVFSGKRGNYVETDVHDCQDVYGISKSKGEPASSTVIRTSIIGRQLNSKYSLVEWVISNNNDSSDRRKTNIIDGYKNHFWNGVTCLQLAKIIHLIIDNNLYWNGVRHIFSPDVVSKYELIKYIIDIYDLNIKLKKFNTDNVVNKSLNTVYNNNSNFNIPTIHAQIKEMYNYKLI